MKTKPFLGGVAVGVGAAALYSVSRTENPQTTVITTVNTPIDQAFHYVAPINLMHIFRGTALISAIVDTSIKAGWNKPGLSRTIYFKDGSTSQETLLTVDAPRAFSYQNEQFTSPVLRFLLKQLAGNWFFTDLGNGQTKIEWTYTTVPTNRFTRLIVATVLIRAVHSMLRNALTIIKQDLETGQLTGEFPANKVA